MLSENGAIADGVGPPKHVQAAILTEEMEELRCKQSRQKVRMHVRTYVCTCVQYHNMCVFVVVSELL